MAKTMDITEVLEGLVNSESDEGCDGGLTVVEKKWVDKIRKHLDSIYKTRMELKRRDELIDLRNMAAEKAFETSKLDGLKCVDSEGWLRESNQWERKFYYEDEEHPEGDSKVATFIVVFKKDSDAIKDEHVNVW